MYRVRTSALGVIVLSLTCAVAAGADPAAHARPSIRVFTDEDGLPQNSVEDVQLDRSGRLWVCTRDGAAFYDGHTWHVVDLPGAGSNWPRAVLAAHDGSVWLGSEADGVFRLADGRWQHWGTSDGLPSARILCLLEARAADGTVTIWAGTGRGLVRWGGERWAVVEGVPGRPVPALTTSVGTSGARVLWAGLTNAGLVRIEHGHVRVYDHLDGLPAGSVQCLLHSRGDPNTLWVGAGNRVFRFDITADRARALEGASAPEGHVVLDLAEVTTPSGALELWVASEGGGVLRCSPAGGCRQLDTRPPLPSPFVFSLHAAPEDGPTRTVWVGTLTGLVRLSLGGWLGLDGAAGLPEEPVVSLLETTDPASGGQVMWMGTAGGGLVRAGRDVRVINTDSRRLDRSVFALAEATDPRGKRVLLAGTGNGLSRREGGRWSAFTTTERLPDAPVVCLLAEPRRTRELRLWAGTYGGGLLRLDGGRLTVIDHRDGLPDDRVEALLATPSARRPEVLWAATDRGLFRLEGDRRTILDRRSGLPDDVVRSLHVSHPPSGSAILWVGTGGGLAWRELDGSGPFRVLSESTVPALANNVVYRIEEDRQGRLYLGTNGGVIRLTPPAEGGVPEPGDLRMYTFTTADGLPSNECTFGASLVDSVGRLWFGTVRGVAVLDPRLEVSHEVRYPLAFAAIHAGAARLDSRQAAAPPVLPYDRNSVEFAYTLRSDFREGDTRYRSQLVGFDPQPSPWVADTKRAYTNLPAGSYRFTVWARNAAGTESGPLIYRFRIEPAPWFTWWAWLLYAATAAFAVTGGVQWRLRALRRRARELAAKVDERTTELAAMVQELRESERRASEAHARLQAAQQKIEELRQAAPPPAADLGRWAERLAGELATAVGVEEIGLFAVRGETLVSLTGGGEGPPLAQTERACREHRWTEWRNRSVVPVTGMAGELVGAMAVPRRTPAWDEAELGLLSSFASHLGASIELHYTRRDLASARERLEAMRRDLIDQGIDILFLCPRCGGCFDQKSAVCPHDGTALRAERAIPVVVGGRYRLERVLGRGAMGAVFVARDAELERRVAVKVLNPSYERSDGQLRLEREIRLISRIEHPGVVAVHDTGTLPDGSRYLVMEYLRGADLARVLADQGVGLPDQVAALARQGGSALEAAHLAGLIHRDVKPHNLFLHRAGEPFQVKILDFGIAKELRVDSQMTATGLIPGTPAYMSPEQIQGAGLDARSDLYAFATVLYEALTGRPVVRPGTLGDVFVEVVYVDPPPVSVLRPTIPRGVDELLATALHKDPAARPHSVARWSEQLAARLESVEDPGVRGWQLDALVGPPAPHPSGIDTGSITMTSVETPASDPSSAPGDGSLDERDEEHR